MCLSEFQDKGTILEPYWQTTPAAIKINKLNKVNPLHRFVPIQIPSKAGLIRGTPLINTVKSQTSDALTEISPKRS